MEYVAVFWKNDIHATILGNKEVTMNCKDTCYSFKVIDETVVKKELLRIHSTHEEADSRMIFHLATIQPPAVLRTIDTDVFIIALGCFSSLNEDLQVWMETGVYTKNTLRYISVNQIYRKLGAKFCEALPAYHAFPGCDYTASFNRKGKVSPFKILEKDGLAQDAFASLNSDETITQDIISTLEEFICKIYGKKKLNQ